MYQLGHVFLRCDIPALPPEKVIRGEIWTVNAQLHCSDYKRQAVYVKGIKGNHIPVVYIKLKLISEDISALHIKVHNCYT